MDVKQKWNSKHTDRLYQNVVATPNTRLMNLAPYLSGGSAVDLACGLGANSYFLAKCNYHVKAFDISDIAINDIQVNAAKQQLPIVAHVRDLTEWNELDLEENTIDLVVITYYLDRHIFPFVKSIIKPNGYFFMETFYLSSINDQNNVSDQYKLQPKELLLEFSEWDILFYEENEQESRQTILARK
ncbi:class I SAM-dependent methyltransferase [Salipaludibacillus daqingensis]|uniref:class I SAM-dependent methyltransferase n=1 Tax=Salipaludibacillus daqingensis TaxID=3041001 RepID=UPI002473D429|nr:methyltransferase domain-containing protein [Salipaludibacillus daqingensis]